MKKNLLKSFLGLFSLAVGMTASAAEVTETYDFGTAVATATPELKLTDQAIEQEGEFNPSTVYVIENPVFGETTMNLNGRLAVNYGPKDNVQMRWMFRASTTDAYKNGLGGQWNNGNETTTANTSFNISVLNLYAGDKLTITFATQSGKGAEPKAVKAGVLKAGDATLNAGDALASGTTYEVVADGTDPVNIDLAVTNNNMAIQCITIVTQEKEAEPEPEPEPEPQPGSNPVVKMTWVDMNAPETSNGEISAGETGRAGFNSIKNGTVDFGNKGWGENKIIYLQVDASAIKNTIIGATLTGEFSGSSDSKRTTNWGVGYNNSTWSADMTYNTADRTITQIGKEASTTTKSAETFEELSFDITDAFINDFLTDNDKVVTLIVYETAAAGGYLKNPTVTLETTDDPAARYSVKYVDAEGKEIKAASSRMGIVGKGCEITDDDKVSLFNEDNTKKYIYESDDAASQTVAADGTTAVTVKFRDAVKWNYVINAEIGEETIEIAKLSDFEGNTAAYNFPRFYNLDGVLYSKEKGSNDPGWYRGTFLLSEDNMTQTVTGYELVDTVRVAYFSEAEDIKGLTLSSNANAGVRMSMGKTAYNAGKEAVKIVTLPAGTYRIMTTTWGSEGQNFVFKAGDQTILTAGCTGSSADASAVFTLTAETDVVLDAPVGEIFNGGIDYVLISNITPATVVENIAALKALPVGTMVRLTLKDTKITVKAATMMGTYTLLEDETGAALIPSTMFGDDLTTALPDVFANDSVALNGYLYAETIDMGGLCALGVCDSTSSSDITVTKTDLTPTTMEIADALKAENLLRYVKLENVTLDEKYVLTQGEATITVQDMMAVLELDDEYNLVVPEAAIDITGFVIDMGTGAMFVPIAPYTEHKADAISGVAADADALDGDVYNLSGVKVRNAGDSLDGLKGLYIINGKKVVLK